MAMSYRSKELLKLVGLLVLLTPLTILGVSMLGAAPPSHEPVESAPGSIAPLPPGKDVAVTGEVVMIEGNMQMVEDPSRKEKDIFMVMEQLYIARASGDEAIQFHVNDNTLVDDDVTVGDKVEVLASPNGDALSIRKTE